MGPLSEIRACRDIPAYCDACAGSARLRRKCACINRPLWAYRMGSNPHNPRRGIRPTFAPVGAEIRREGEPAATCVSAALQ